MSLHWYFTWVYEISTVIIIFQMNKLWHGEIKYCNVTKVIAEHGFDSWQPESYACSLNHHTMLSFCHNTCLLQGMIGRTLDVLSHLIIISLWSRWNFLYLFYRSRKWGLKGLNNLSRYVRGRFRIWIFMYPAPKSMHLTTL